MYLIEIQTFRKLITKQNETELEKIRKRIIFCISNVFPL